MDKNIRVNHMVENSNKNGQNFLDMKKYLNNTTQGVVWAPLTAKKIGSLTFKSDMLNFLTYFFSEIEMLAQESRKKSAFFSVPAWPLRKKTFFEAR